MFRARPIINPSVNSAVGSVSKSGTFVTSTPRSVQAAMSKLLYPFSAPAMIRRLGQRSRKPPSMASVMKAIKASASVQCAASVAWSHGAAVSFVTSGPAAASRLRTLSWILLETTVLNPISVPCARHKN